ETETETEIQHKLYFDGCSKSNPGLSGSGSVIYDANNNEIWTDAYFVGNKQTNNFAEYTGLYRGLMEANKMGLKQLAVFGDSNLVIKQMKGEFKVNSENLIGIYEECKKLANKFEIITFQHIYRRFNTRADELSNQGIIGLNGFENDKIKMEKLKPKSKPKSKPKKNHRKTKQ
ncbi:MAG: reverse transcriptase-like protein, partial [Crocinitomicaceae bacterium]|nr:reverse transcriptase-like protein [Crocinitomicaceae bacterium]